MLSCTTCILLSPLVAVVLLSALVRVIARKYYTYPVPEADGLNTIIITGCDSGIGKETALYLAEGGYAVVASVFTAAGAKQLQREAAALPGAVHCLGLDITKQQSVDDFKAGVEALVESDGLRIVGLVNNAGASWSGPVEFQPVEDFDKQIQVNLVGHVRMCHDFIPFIRRNAGRIVNVASVAGLVAMPSMAAYAASKFGLEAVSDSLRAELRDYHVSVSVIEPGWVQTPLVENVVSQMERNWDRLGDEAREVYKKLHDFEANYLPNALETGIQPIVVAKAITHALTSPNPKTRYQVGVTAKIPYYCKLALPTRVFDTIVHWSMTTVGKRRR